MNEYLPTKTNLMRIQDSIRLSKQGQELLERKRMILVKEKEKYEEKANNLRMQMQTLFSEAYLLLQDASIDMGMEKIAVLANGIKKENSIDIKYRTIMGVEIPSVIWKEQEENQKLNYGFYETTISLDKAVLKFNEIKEKMLILAELENTVKRLELSIIKVQTRSNALQNIIIPENEKIEKSIQNALEEKEREDFSRLKVVKRRKL